MVAEIGADLARPQPMHRLLQGDVGSGKTVVAALAAAVAMDAGWQCALMAPTEILAEQHFRKLVRLAGAAGRAGGLAHRQPQGQGAHRRWSSAWPRARRCWWWARTPSSRTTWPSRGWAWPSSTSSTASAWQQRLALRQQAATKQALEPHLLMMSATPIPRTLAMSYFADLDVSTIDELPPGPHAGR